MQVNSVKTNQHERGRECQEGKKRLFSGAALSKGRIKRGLHRFIIDQIEETILHRHWCMLRSQLARLSPYATAQKLRPSRRLMSTAVPPADVGVPVATDMPAEIVAAMEEETSTPVGKPAHCSLGAKSSTTRRKWQAGATPAKRGSTCGTAGRYGG